MDNLYNDMNEAMEGFHYYYKKNLQKIKKRKK